MPLYTNEDWYASRNKHDIYCIECGDLTDEKCDECGAPLCLSCGSSPPADHLCAECDHLVFGTDYFCDGGS